MDSIDSEKPIVPSSIQHAEPSTEHLSQRTEDQVCDQGTPLPVHVVVLTHYLPPYTASVLNRLSQLVKRFEVMVSIDQEPNRDFGNTRGNLDVRVQKSWMLRRPWKHGKGGFQDELYVHFPYDTFSQLRRANPDIVFSYELGFRSLVSALYCVAYRKKLALCACMSERTEQGRGILRWALRHLLLRLADAVTYNGPSCRAYLKRFHVPDSKLFHYPYAVTEQFSYDGSIERQPEARRRLVVVGQLIARKGVLPMLSALVAYCQARPDKIVELDMIGKGPQESEIRSMKLPDNLKLRMLGSMKVSAMTKELENSGIMLFPTLADEWGLVVNEAMQAGMPVIGSEFAQACTTLIRHGDNGWLYNPDFPETLFQSLDAMYATSDAELASMRYVAQETVRDITPVNVARMALAMFRKLDAS